MSSTLYDMNIDNQFYYNNQMDTTLDSISEQNIITQSNINFLSENELPIEKMEVDEYYLVNANMWNHPDDDYLLKCFTLYILKQDPPKWKDTFTFWKTYLNERQIDRLRILRKRTRSSYLKNLKK
jgi:hypothetical protein